VTRSSNSLNTIIRSGAYTTYIFASLGGLSGCGCGFGCGGCGLSGCGCGFGCGGCGLSGGSGSGGFGCGGCGLSGGSGSGGFGCGCGCGLSGGGGSVGCYSTLGPPLIRFMNAAIGFSFTNGRMNTTRLPQPRSASIEHFSDSRLSHIVYRISGTRESVCIDAHTILLKRRVYTL